MQSHFRGLIGRKVNMSDKLRNVILTCFLILICQNLTCCEIVKEDAEQQMTTILWLYFIEHSAFSTTIGDFLLELQETNGNIILNQTDFNVPTEIDFTDSFIREEVIYYYVEITKSVFKQNGLDKEQIAEKYKNSKDMFAVLFSSKDLDEHPINHISNEGLKTLYFECFKNILDSWEKLYDYSRTGSSKDKKDFLKTSVKLEESLLILYQRTLEEHGLDSDILHAVKTRNQNYREAFVSDMRNFLLYLNDGLLVLAHSYNLNDSRSLSDWSKTTGHLIEKEIQLKTIVFFTSIEWANHEHVKEKLIEIVKNQENKKNRVLADILYEYLTSKYRTEYWFVIVYDAVDEIDEGGQGSLVGIHLHHFQVDGKIVLAFHHSKFMTTVREYVNFRNQFQPFNPIDRIAPFCDDGKCDLKPHDFLDLLRTENLYDEYSIIVLPPKTNSHYYYSDECPDFHIFQSLLKGNPSYSLFFVKSHSYYKWI